MTLMDIRNALSTKISAKFENVQVYSEKVRVGFERPAFFIDIIPISNLICNKYLVEKSIMVDIFYIPEIVSDKESEENLTLVDKLNGLFSTTFIVLDRAITLQNSKIEIIDSILHYKFELNFMDDNEDVEEEQPLAQKIKINTEGV